MSKICNIGWGQYEWNNSQAILFSEQPICIFVYLVDWTETIDFKAGKDFAKKKNIVLTTPKGEWSPIIIKINLDVDNILESFFQILLVNIWGEVETHV